MIRNKTATYALLALYEIAEQHRETSPSVGVRAHDIAHKHRLPKAYVAKILSQLANAEILHSDRGPRGGFRLNRSADNITLFDIFEGVGAVAANNRKRRLVKGLPQSVAAALNRAHDDITEMLKDILQQTTLADVLPSGGRR
jgi:Rrf2 family protein